MTPGVALAEWARLLAGTLAALGIRQVVVSPGSRSTPFVLALLERPELVTRWVLDERAAAFVALGHARVTGVPSLLVCTSGSALAHFAPALVEADAARLPLIVLSADRPLSLQGCGASQTIEQAGFFGSRVRIFLDLGPPSPDAFPALPQRVARAVHAALFPLPGPVHLNAPAEKPLEPVAPVDAADRACASEVDRLLDRGPARVALPRITPDQAALRSLAAELAGTPRGLLVLGPLPVGSARLARLVGELSRRLGYPTLAESGSQLRHGALAAESMCCGPHDLLCAVAAPRLQPDVVLRIGAPPVSEALDAALRAWGAARHHVLAAHPWPDPTHQAHTLTLGDLEFSLEGLLASLGPVAEPAARQAYGRLWAALDRAARAAIEESEATGSGLTEGRAVRACFEAVPNRALLMLGNSLPVRELDHFLPPSPRAVDVLTQRGASGIDGLLAGAAGAAQASGRPVWLLLGDQSYLHDASSLPLLRGTRTKVLVLDNGGGRIFEGLPVARSPRTRPHLEYWTTPHHEDLVAIARARRVLARQAREPDELTEALEVAQRREDAEVIVATVGATSAAESYQRARRALERHLLEEAPCERA